VLLGLSNTDLKEMGIRALGARKRILKKTKDKTGFCHFLSFRRAFLKARLLMSAAMGCPARGSLFCLYRLAILVSQEALYKLTSRSTD
jgi:hypothetical protein